MARVKVATVSSQPAGTQGQEIKKRKDSPKASYSHPKELHCVVLTSLLIKHPARLKMIRAPKEAREPYRRIPYAWVTFPQPRESRWEVPSIAWHLG